MGLIVRGFEKIANSNVGTKFFKWTDTPKGKNFMSNNLPNLQTFVATCCYTVATEKQDLDRRRKNLLHIQNWIPALIGMGIGTYLNQKVSKFGDKIIQHLDTNQVKNMHKIIGATKFLLPIFTTALLMRFTLPVITAFVSGEIEEHKAKSKRLDIKA